jgi:tetratricopeptide (TPR) repeat protein
LECYEKALDIEPNNSAMLTNKGVCLSNLNLQNEAIECLKKALACSIDDSDTFLIKQHLSRY